MQCNCIHVPVCCLPMNGAVDHRTPCVNFLRLRLLVLLPSSPHPPSFPPSAYSFSFTPSDLHLINCSLSFFSLPSPYPSISSPLLSFDSLSLSPLSPLPLISPEPRNDMPRPSSTHRGTTSQSCRRRRSESSCTETREESRLPSLTPRFTASLWRTETRWASEFAVECCHVDSNVFLASKFF